MTSRTSLPRLTVVLSLSGDGGVEHMVLNLVAEFAEQGYPVDLVLLRDEGGHRERIPEGVQVTRIGASAALAVLPLARYLRRRRPSALLVAKERAGRAVARARALSGVSTRLVLRLGNTVSASLANAPRLKRWWRLRALRTACRRADTVVAVSDGVAAEVAAVSGITPERIRVVRNPVITPRLHQLAEAPIPHPWLGPQREAPVLMGIGRLRPQKDFPTLLRAFAQVRRARACRLILLGEGPERGELERLAEALGVQADVLLPGFQPNPYRWLARADLFVLSSAWEGSPNVLTEALALGVPAVATDCPSGPRETLQAGRVGPLVPVGDAPALAQAIQATLDEPPAAAHLQEAVAAYRAELSAARYLELLIGDAPACG